MLCQYFNWVLGELACSTTITVQVLYCVLLLYIIIVQCLESFLFIITMLLISLYPKREEAAPSLSSSWRSTVSINLVPRPFVKGLGMKVSMEESNCPFLRPKCVYRRCLAYPYLCSWSFLPIALRWPCGFWVCQVPWAARWNSGEWGKEEAQLDRHGEAWPVLSEGHSWGMEIVESHVMIMWL